MIFFLSTKHNRQTIDRYLGSWGKSLRPIIQPVAYENFLQKKQLWEGIYIFADIELLSDNVRAKVLEKYNLLRSSYPSSLLLNHPMESMRRYQLLKTFYSQGINTFNVYRLSEDWPKARYPVFLHGENDHLGKRSELLNNRQQLEDTIAQLKKHGYDTTKMLVEEFCNTADRDGVFRKYSAFCIGEDIIPRHIFFSKNWCQKNDDLVDAEKLTEEMNYLTENPHREMLRTIFHTAQIQYGRIDYGLYNGRIQTWEINTNPMILVGSHRNEQRQKVHETFNANLSQIWQKLDKKQPYNTRKNNYTFEPLRTSWYIQKEKLRRTKAIKNLTQLVINFKIFLFRLWCIIRNSQKNVSL